MRQKNLSHTFKKKIQNVSYSGNIHYIHHNMGFTTPLGVELMSLIEAGRPCSEMYVNYVREVIPIQVRISEFFMEKRR